MDNLILSNQQNNVLTIQFNRIDKKNALTLAMYKQLIALFTQAQENDDIHCVVIQGNHQCFCAGNDLADFIKLSDSDVFDAFEFVKVLAKFNKPIVAAVAGPAVGIGTTMLLHCDMVFATANSQLKLPFTQIGLCPEAGASLLLTQKLGHNKAFELLVLGSSFNGEQAHQLGIINHIVTEEELIATAQKAASGIAKLPRQSVQASRRLLKQPIEQQLLEVIDNEAAEFKRLLKSQECQQIIASFFKAN